MNIQFENLGTVNKNKVTIGDYTFWFSYETCVAFQRSGYALIVRENDWGQTTGKLLNQLEPDKKNRIEGTKFEAMLDEITVTADRTFASK